MDKELEISACQPVRVEFENFNGRARIPYGLTQKQIWLAMNDFVEFLGFINKELHRQGLRRLESMLMPANFSSIVGEFMCAGIPKYCSSLAKNGYHNGHPDLIPASTYPLNAIQHADEGIEIKASRYQRGWQGHNPEDTWLLVFVFESNRPKDDIAGLEPIPFRFLTVMGAKLTKADWLFAGRSETSRRTITASVTKSGYEKMSKNWIYKSPNLLYKR